MIYKKRRKVSIVYLGWKMTTMEFGKIRLSGQNFSNVSKGLMTLSSLFRYNDMPERLKAIENITSACIIVNREAGNVARGPEADSTAPKFSEGTLLA